MGAGWSLGADPWGTSLGLPVSLCPMKKEESIPAGSQRQKPLLSQVGIASALCTYGDSKVLG
jgi:hypothetical protein